MRTFISSNKTVFHYNADLSGFVVVQCEDKRELVIPGHDLMEFAANIVKEHRISEMENMDWKAILRIK